MESEAFFDQEDPLDEWLAMCNASIDRPEPRAKCNKCCRPANVCYCFALSPVPIDTQHRVVVLQHPAEIKRCLQTGRMLQLGLAADKCFIYRGKHFPNSKTDDFLRGILQDKDRTLLLYPTIDSVPIDEVDPGGGPYNLILIDGTWPQAKSMMASSSCLHGLRKVKLVNTETSRYVIRTQPADGCLSTLETAAEALSRLEQDRDLYEALVRPLTALCNFQIEKGAVHHHSKEHLIKTNTYPKQIGKRLARLLKQTDKINESTEGVRKNSEGAGDEGDQ